MTRVGSGWRFIAQRTATGDFLDWDVPFVPDGPPRRELNGPGSMVGTIAPEYMRLMAKPDGLPVITEWATTLYAEYAGNIRWGGIVTRVSYQGQAMKLECTGFSAYPNGMPFQGSSIQSGVAIPQKYAYEGKDKNHDGYIDGTSPKKKMPPRPKDKITARWDSYDVVRHIWAHLQSFNGGNLGLVVDGHDSGHLLGASNGTDPWELHWWDTPDCGQTISDVMSQAGADYIERHQWDGTREKVLHFLDLGNPRHLGRSRSDLRFATGENIIETATPTGQGEWFANQIYVLGKGVGSKTARVRVIYDDKRLRRARVSALKTTSSAATLTAYGQSQRARHSQMLTVPSIAVKHHPNAALGSWALGDLILLQLEVPWIGDVVVWHRIVAEEIDPAAGTAVLTLTRADYYG
ncbi:hypothetical protein ACIP9H_33645 [Streptomyces sp. NPDC088732]|uniref:hypothetical protein n=1 Tax=Streptomyces sp. NPDC088732 TaxID=3365879 RepID=UPI003817EB1C